MQSLSDTGWFVESCDAIAFVMAFSSTLATLGLLQPWTLRVSKLHVDRSHGLNYITSPAFRKPHACTCTKQRLATIVDLGRHCVITTCNFNYLTVLSPVLS